MKSCSILISNYNSFEAIQLCVESIRKFTRYPYHMIIYDDNSTNEVDVKYLVEIGKKGWSGNLFGIKRLNHGGAINVLLNYCHTDLAMILDNDIEILGPGWLEEMVALAGDDVLLISGIERDYKSDQFCYPDWFQTWFMMLNMEAYRDGAEIDWNRVTEDGIMIPTGAKLHIKMRKDNPKGYKFITPIPEYIQKKYRHFAHVSCIATSDPSDSPKFIKAREEKMSEIRRALVELRNRRK